MKNEEVLFLIGNVMFTKVGMVTFLRVTKPFLHAESLYSVTNSLTHSIIIPTSGSKHYQLISFTEANIT